MRIFLFSLLIYPFLEILALVLMTEHLGAWFTLGWIITGAVIGLVMLRNKQIGKLLTLGALFKQGDTISLYSLLWPLRYVLSGVLFIVPGVISKLLAILLLLPFKGPTFKSTDKDFYVFHSTRTEGTEDAIEGEFSDLTPVQDDHYLPDKPPTQK